MIYDQIIEKIRNLKKEYKRWKEENILIEKEEKNINKYKKELLKEHRKNVLFFNI